MSIPAIISGILHAEKLGDSGRIWNMPSIWRSLSPQNGLTSDTGRPPDHEWLSLHNSGWRQVSAYSDHPEICLNCTTPASIFHWEKRCHTGSPEPSASSRNSDGSHRMYLSRSRKESFDRTGHQICGFAASADFKRAWKTDGTTS